MYLFVSTDFLKLIFACAILDENSVLLRRLISLPEFSSVDKDDDSFISVSFCNNSFVFGNSCGALSATFVVYVVPPYFNSWISHNHFTEKRETVWGKAHTLF